MGRPAPATVRALPYTGTSCLHALPMPWGTARSSCPLQWFQSSDSRGSTQRSSPVAAACGATVRSKRPGITAVKETIAAAVWLREASNWVAVDLLCRYSPRWMLCLNRLGIIANFRGSFSAFWKHHTQHHVFGSRRASLRYRTYVHTWVGMNK